LQFCESVREVTKGKPKLDIPSQRELILPQKVIIAIAVGRVLSMIARAWSFTVSSSMPASEFSRWVKICVVGCERYYSTLS
jgi:hypothetical protein